MEISQALLASCMDSLPTWFNNQHHKQYLLMQKLSKRDRCRTQVSDMYDG